MCEVFSWFSVEGDLWNCGKWLGSYYYSIKFSFITGGDVEKNPGWCFWGCFKAPPVSAWFSPFCVCSVQAVTVCVFREVMGHKALAPWGAKARLFPGADPGPRARGGVHQAEQHPLLPGCPRAARGSQQVRRHVCTWRWLRLSCFLGN